MKLTIFKFLFIIIFQYLVLSGKQARKHELCGARAILQIFTGCSCTRKTGFPGRSDQPVLKTYLILEQK